MIRIKDVLWAQLDGRGENQYTAKAELMDRLNLSFKGIDPGPPLHWKGL